MKKLITKPLGGLRDADFPKHIQDRFERRNRILLARLRRFRQEVEAAGRSSTHTRPSRG